MAMYRLTHSFILYYNIQTFKEVVSNLQDIGQHVVVCDNILVS